MSAGITIRFEDGTWQSSDAKGLLDAGVGSIDTLIPNLLALRSANSNNIAHLQGFSLCSAKVGQESDGVVFRKIGPAIEIGWRIEQII